ncbi:redoxin domain-containing protein [Alicyclobacillus tolerans]|uniref:TlpA family protein disulfide reductase n=1 Tax=Alicyclobacillus tolerans TaxID=90970 RepID=UPI001F1D58D1|nr:redoxin domain-containing protein [Alicyclobacillus tolerans]MCF8563403.1 redoxin domain-containing protein [Alicyclobacillus tolerans]
MNRRVKMAVLAAGLLVAVMGYLTWAVFQSEAVPKVGQAVPNLSLPEVTAAGSLGQTVSLSELKGKPVLLNFFTTWCAPCQTEAADIAAVGRQWHNKVQIVLVDRGESAYLVHQFVTRYDLTKAVVLLDQNDNWASRLGVTGQPETFWIDANGVIQKHIPSEMGYSQWQALAKQAASAASPAPAQSSASASS